MSPRPSNMLCFHGHQKFELWESLMASTLALDHQAVI